MRRSDLQRTIRILQMRKIKTMIFCSIALGFALWIWLPIVHGFRYDIKIRKPIYKAGDCISTTFRHGEEVAIHPYKILRVDQHQYLMELLFNNPEHKSEFEKFGVVDEQFKKMNCPSITSPSAGSEVKIPQEFQISPESAMGRSTPSESQK